MKRLLVSLAAVACALALVPTADAGAGGATFGHWDGVGDRNIPIVNSTTAGWSEAFNHAVAVWTPSTVLNLIPEVGSSTKRSREKCKGIPGTIRVCNYAYGRSKGWAGLAITSKSGGHIVQSRVKLNQSFIKPGSKFDTRLTCHEVGHAIGLNHSNDPQGCLTPFLNDGDDTPTAQNFIALQNEYSHLHAMAARRGDIDVTIVQEGDVTTRIVKIYPPR